MRGGFSVSRFFFVICRIVVVICLFVARCRQTNESCHWQKIGCWKEVWINLNLAHGKKCINIHNIHTIACTKASIDLNVIGNLNANIDVNNIGTEWRKNFIYLCLDLSQLLLPFLALSSSFSSYYFLLAIQTVSHLQCRLRLLVTLYKWFVSICIYFFGGMYALYYATVWLFRLFNFFFCTCTRQPSRVLSRMNLSYRSDLPR